MGANIAAEPHLRQQLAEGSTFLEGAALPRAGPAPTHWALRTESLVEPRLRYPVIHQASQMLTSQVGV